MSGQTRECWLLDCSSKTLSLVSAVGACVVAQAVGSVNDFKHAVIKVTLFPSSRSHGGLSYGRHERRRGRRLQTVAPL